MQTPAYTKRSIQNAYDLAAKLRLYTTVEPIGDGYAVGCMSGRHVCHIVRPRGAGWACDCEAASRGLWCGHLGAAALAKARDDSARSIAAERVAAVSAPASNAATTLRAAGGGRSALVLSSEEEDAASMYAALGAGR